jgi:hypothetical protein
VEQLLRQATERYPEDTLLHAFFVPLIRGAGELERGRAGQALALLEATRPYEIGPIPFWSVHLRGQAALVAKDGKKAAAEFQSILDRRGGDPFSPLCALAQLGLARALWMSGDLEKSLGAYEAFFKLWADADEDLIILRQAKSEYERLRQSIS